jgi:hypothetical protein
VDEILPGRLSHIFLISIFDAALLSWITLRLYRRSVRRLMLAPVSRAANPSNVVDKSAAETPGSDAIRFALIDQASGASASALPTRPPLLRRVGLAYCVGALAYAAVMTWLILAPVSPPLPLGAWTAQWWIHAWPVVPALAALMVMDRPGWVRLAGWYLLAGSLLVAGSTLALQVLRGSLNSAPVTNVFWMLVSLGWSAALPLALLLITGWRRVRAVMPLVLATTLLFGFASMMSVELMVRMLSVPALTGALLDVAALTSAEAALFAPLLIVSLPVGWLAWRLVRWLAGAFERKRFSDVQLVVDCWWIVVTAERVATSLAAMYGFWSLLGGFAAFAAYRVGVALMLRPADRASNEAPKRLLLLRVFGYEARTEALFDTVAQRWRLRGPVQLIAGVDLAMRTADPGDLLAFINGRLADNWVRSPEDVAPRLRRLDLARDPDSRFRVNELYCRDDSWRPTLEALLDITDAVLMDLRSFRAQNAGCIFELEQLVRRIPTDEIVLVCDQTTDLPLLGRVLGAAWQEARRGGAARGSGAIALVRMDRQSPREIDALMTRLIDGGASPPVLAAAGLPPAPA